MKKLYKRLPTQQMKIAWFMVPSRELYGDSHIDVTYKQVRNINFTITRAIKGPQCHSRWQNCAKMSITPASDSISPVCGAMYHTASVDVQFRE